MSVHLPAIVTTAEGTHQAVLLDLSLRGARFQGGSGHQLGQRAILQWHTYEALGTICWFEDAICGLAFDAALSIRDLLDTRNLDRAGPPGLKREAVRRMAAAFVSGGVQL
ncbi:hypothetical protein H7F53_16830 [Novosphingobium piscinae]|uniref:PilZ domain-containing protein n=1 Tax=Novosphingobium piscinae TaxID=1507448 RepID=A0A7X1G1A0_9SPHN|nr:hypothetical protein [Novosphingobium piscinae]